TGLPCTPVTFALLCSDYLLDRLIAWNLITCSQDIFSILCLVQQIDESLISNRRVLEIKKPAKARIFHAGSLLVSVFYVSLLSVLYVLFLELSRTEIRPLTEEFGAECRA